jgi:Ca-activated chloride channel homolog
MEESTVKRILCAVLILALGLLAAGSAGADKAASSNRKGIRAYHDNKFEESAGRFTEALVERPDTPELRFNLGTALSAQGKKDAALSELISASRGLSGREKAAAAHFNAGNLLYASNDYQGAVDAYKKAVKLDQQSPDIRHNLELAVRKLTDRKKDPNNKDNQEKKGDRDNNQKNKSQNQNQNKQQNKEQQQSQQQNNELKPMTKDEAQRLLNAINDDEKKSLSLRHQQMKTKVRQGDDW